MKVGILLNIKLNVLFAKITFFEERPKNPPFCHSLNQKFKFLKTVIFSNNLLFSNNFKMRLNSHKLKITRVKFPYHLKKFVSKAQKRSVNVIFFLCALKLTSTFFRIFFYCHKDFPRRLLY